MLEVSWRSLNILQCQKYLERPANFTNVRKLSIKRQGTVYNVHIFQAWIRLFGWVVARVHSGGNGWTTSLCHAGRRTGPSGKCVKEWVSVSGRVALTIKLLIQVSEEWFTLSEMQQYIHSPNERVQCKQYTIYTSLCKVRDWSYTARIKYKMHSGV